MPRSSYYYQHKARTRADKYAEIREHLLQLFAENKERYGYRRLHRCLTKEKKQVSEKVVRCIMREEGLNVKTRKRRKYNSYQGEITPPVPNLVERNFHAASPNKLLLTDITEFAIPAGKVYLSPSFRILFLHRYAGMFIIS